MAIGVAAAAVLAVGVPYLYSNVIAGDAPEPLAAATTSTAASAGAADSGSDSGTDSAADSETWRVADGSEAGYRVKEVLFGQDAEAVGRTSAVTGEATVDGSTVTAASFEVDLTTVQSDQGRRDAQFQDRIMDTATYPTASFKLTSPIDVAALRAAGSTATVQATGDLTVQRGDGAIQVSGAIPVTFADYGIPNPGFGPVTTDDHGQIEFLLVLGRG